METEILSKCNLCGSDKIKMIDQECNICACESCEYIFDSPRPVFQEIKDFYSLHDKYDAWLEQEDLRVKLWQRRLALVKRYIPSGKLLDIGTGIGQFLHFASKDFDVSGTEVSDSAIKIAKEKYGLDIKQGEIENIQWKSEFDVITLFHVLEHVPDPSVTINKCRELLKEDGIIIIAVPNDTIGIRPAIVRILRLFKVGKFQYFGKLGLPKIVLDGSIFEIHLSHFTVPVLKRFFEHQGFSVVHTTLDPFFVETGIMKIIHNIIYVMAMVYKKIFRKNIYFTTWLVAKKVD